MKTITVNTSTTYDIYIERGILKNCGKIIADTIKTRKIAVITDDIVDLKQSNLFFQTEKLRNARIPLTKFIRSYAKIILHAPIALSLWAAGL